MLDDSKGTRYSERGVKIALCRGWIGESLVDKRCRAVKICIGRAPIA
ncbi:hypothetical protein [Paraburkholderia solisilvae]|nr:hypothetical protein [Paraburkholderia solisilvae]